jgi:hypothetical protein
LAKASEITSGVIEAVTNVPISASLITNLSTSASWFFRAASITRNATWLLVPVQAPHRSKSHSLGNPIALSAAKLAETRKGRMLASGLTRGYKM